MKKILPFILIAFLSYNAKSQITVNSIDLNIGDVVLQASDTTYQTELLSSGGSDLTWDFFGVNAHTVDTIAPIDPATTNHASSFTESNLALGSVDLAGYFVNTPNEYVFLGFGGFVPELNQDLEMVLTDPDTAVVFPLNYNDSRYSDSWGETYTNIQGQDLRISSSTQRTQTCDAWGTATTPHGTYDVLRVQELEISIDSVFAILYGYEAYQEDYSTFDTTYRYTFYTDDATIKYPLLEVKYDHNVDTILETKWITFLPNNTNKVELNSSEVSIYPNPSKDYINIETNENIEVINIYNTQGKLVKTENQNHIQVSDLPASIYFIEVVTNQNIYKEKILVK